MSTPNPTGPNPTGPDPTRPDPTRADPAPSPETMTGPATMTSAERARLRDQRLQRSKVLATVLAVLCVVLATVGVRVSNPDPDDVNARYVKGELGQPMTFKGAELTVTGVRVGQLIADREKITLRTPGMFVLVRVQLVNRNALEKVTLTKSRLRTEDRIYAPHEALTSISATPGYVGTAEFLYQVDPQQIDGLTLEIWSQGIVYGFHDRLRIPLGITAENADRWRAAAEGTALSRVKYSQERVLQ